jgi:hypothetical protein
MARIVSKAMEQAGLRASVKAEHVGDYKLGAVLGEGPAYQDYEAEHVALHARRRVRLYPIPPHASAELRQTVVRPARVPDPRRRPPSGHPAGGRVPRTSRPCRALTSAAALTTIGDDVTRDISIGHPAQTDSAACAAFRSRRGRCLSAGRLTFWQAHVSRLEPTPEHLAPAGG